MPTLPVTRPFSYEQWELDTPRWWDYKLVPLSSLPLNDMACMGRTWYLDALASIVMNDTERLVLGATGVCRRQADRILARTLHSGGERHGLAGQSGKVLRIPRSTHASRTWQSPGLLLTIAWHARIAREHLSTELGQVLLGQRPGHCTTDEITLFKSVGLAIQDLYAARSAYDNAQLTERRSATSAIDRRRGVADWVPIRSLRKTTGSQLKCLWQHAAVFCLGCVLPTAGPATALVCGQPPQGTPAQRGECGRRRPALRATRSGRLVGPRPMRAVGE